MSRIGILDAELKCMGCGQKIKLAHLKCQIEKRNKQIKKFIDDLIKCKCGIPSHEYKVKKLIKKYEAEIK